MKVYLYVLNTMADWEIGYLTAELYSRRFFKNRDIDLEIVKTGSTEDPIITMGGITIKPDMSIDSVTFREEDILVLPGADTWMDKENAKVLSVAKELIGNGLKVAAICGATFGLAKVGALNNLMHTSNDKEYLRMICPEYSGSDNYQEKLAVCDNNLITASVLAPLEFTCEILRSIGVFKEDTLKYWYMLYSTKEAKYFHLLMDSLKE